MLPDQLIFGVVLLDPLCRLAWHLFSQYRRGSDVAAWSVHTRDPAGRFFRGPHNGPIVSGLSLALLLAAHTVVTLPIVVPFHENGLAWIIGVLVQLIVGIAVTCVIHSIMHYQKSSSASIYQYIGSRYDSDMLRIFASIVGLCAMLLSSGMCIAWYASYVNHFYGIDDSFQWIWALAIGIVIAALAIVGGQAIVANGNAVLAAICVPLALIPVVAKGAVENQWVPGGDEPSNATNGSNPNSSHTGHFYDLEKAAENELEPFYVAQVVLFNAIIACNNFLFNQIVHQHCLSAASIAKGKAVRFIGLIGGFLLCALAAMCAIIVTKVATESTDVGLCGTTNSTAPLEDCAIHIGDAIIQAIFAQWPAAYGAVRTLQMCALPAYALAALVAAGTLLYTDIVQPFVSAYEDHIQMRAARLSLAAAAVVCVLPTTGLLLATSAPVGAVWLRSADVQLAAAAICAPIAAAMLSGMLLPCVNRYGAIVAVCIGMVVGVAFGVEAAIRRPFLFDASYARDTAALDAALAHTVASPPSGNHLIPPLLLPALTFALSTVIALFVSVATGGQDLYTLDWNLVRHMRACYGCTDRLSYGKHGRGGGGVAQQYTMETEAHLVASQSFRYSHHKMAAMAQSHKC